MVDYGVDDNVIWGGIVVYEISSNPTGFVV